MAGPHAIDVLLSILPLLAYCWSFFFLSFFLSLTKGKLKNQKKDRKTVFVSSLIYFFFFYPSKLGVFRQSGGENDVGKKGGYSYILCILCVPLDDLLPLFTIIVAPPLPNLNEILARAKKKRKKEKTKKSIVSFYRCPQNENRKLVSPLDPPLRYGGPLHHIRTNIFRTVAL